jgi:hypothetical protein
MQASMTDIVTASSNKLDNWNGRGPWYEGTHGERIAYNSPVSIRTARMRSLNPLQLPPFLVWHSHATRRHFCSQLTRTYYH